MDLSARLSVALEGRYEIVREIGRGGMSVVFLARDLRLDREVAIKALRPELTESVGAERFQREIQLVAHFEHIHLLQLHESGTADGVLFYVMPYARDGSLRDLLRKERQLSRDDIVRITTEVADGLAHAHKQDVVHRDIKPENILFVDGHAVIADFGIAHAYSEAGGESFTEYGLAIGTPVYMSPEQAAGDPQIDRRSDIYSLACVVYEMLSGGPPFDGPTTQAILAKHMHERVPSLTVVRSGLPEAMAQAVEKALEKVPAERFQNATDFASALEQGQTLTSPHHPPSVRESLIQLVTTPWVVAIVAIVALGAAAFPIARAVWSNGVEPSFQHRPESMLVMPYSTRASTAAELDLTADLADGITRELNTWEATRAVTGVELRAPMIERGLTGPTLDRVDDGLDLARALDVQALVTLTVTLRDDSVHAGAMLYDAATNKAVGDALLATGPANHADRLVRTVAHAILGLHELGTDSDELRRRSRHPDALFADIQGTRSLGRWRLEEAERHFRQAIALDSTFALALHHLAHTLYWHAAQGTRHATATKPEITQLSAGAVRHSSGGPPTDSLLIHAFQFVQDGDYADYARARALLDELLQMDPTNTYAQLLRASVEVEDRWLERKPNGSLAPRSNLNVAMRIFTDLLRQQAGFDLGYGHLGTIYREIARAARAGGCSGFERPRDDLLIGWERPTPHQMLAFCPVSLDSIVWTSTEALKTIPRATAEAGAQRRMSEWTRLLHWWTSTAPDVSKPRTELAWVALDQRTLLDLAPPETVDSLARLALHHTSQALALEPDTLPIDFVWLGALHLGAGNLDSASLLTDRGLDLMETRGEVPPAYAANVFLATGQPTRALPIAGAIGTRSFVPDPADGHLIGYGGAERHIYRALVLGATGVSGAALQTELDAILRLWADPHYSARERLVLREDALESLAIPFSVDGSALDRWIDDLEPTEPLWHALRSSGADRESAGAVLEHASQASEPLIDKLYQPYLLGQVASILGDHTLAIRHYARLDSIPLRLDRLSSAWGFRSLSYLLRAEAYEANGDDASAREQYQRFMDAWAEPDSLTMPLVKRAREHSK